MLSISSIAFFDAQNAQQFTCSNCAGAKRRGDEGFAETRKLRWFCGDFDSVTARDALSVGAKAETWFLAD